MDLQFVMETLGYKSRGCLQVSDSKRRDVLQWIMKQLLTSSKTCCVLGVKIQILLFLVKFLCIQIIYVYKCTYVFKALHLLL